MKPARIVFYSLVYSLAALAGLAAFALPMDEEAYAPAPEQKSYFDLLRVDEAWRITRGSADCALGIIDSGFDFFHPALVKNIEPGYFSCGFYHTDNYQMLAHGTVCASMISARRVEEGGMVGLAPDCPLIAASIGMPVHRLLKIQSDYFAAHPGASMADFQAEMMKHIGELQKFGETWIDYVSRTTGEAVRYLTDRGIRVINISMFLDRNLLGRNPRFVRRIDEAFEYAAKHDVLIVLGAGNSGTLVEDYPGTPETVLVAGACDLKGERWEMTVEQKGMKIKQGSCYGKRLGVLAPSVNLYTAVPHEKAFYIFEDSPVGKEKVEFKGGYELMPVGATSLATTIVSSLAGLVRSLRPDLKTADVIRIIQKGAVDLGEKGFDRYTGYGRVDFAATLAIARDWPGKEKKEREEEKEQP